MPNVILEIKDLHTYFMSKEGVVKAVNGVSFTLEENSILGLVGESGSGKSVTCMAVMQLLGPRALIRGNVRYRKQDLLGLDEKAFEQGRVERISG